MFQRIAQNALRQLTRNNIRRYSADASHADEHHSPVKFKIMAGCIIMISVGIVRTLIYWKNDDAYWNYPQSKLESKK